MIAKAEARNFRSCLKSGLGLGAKAQHTCQAQGGATYYPAGSCYKP